MQSDHGNNTVRLTELHGLSSHRSGKPKLCITTFVFCVKKANSAGLAATGQALLAYLSTTDRNLMSFWRSLVRQPRSDPLSCISCAYQDSKRWVLLMLTRRVLIQYSGIKTALPPIFGKKDRFELNHCHTLVIFKNHAYFCIERLHSNKLSKRHPSTVTHTHESLRYTEHIKANRTVRAIIES